MRKTLSLFTLLCILCALPTAFAADREETVPGECEKILKQHQEEPTPRAQLIELSRTYGKGASKDIDPEELRNHRLVLIGNYNKAIEVLEKRIEELKLAFKFEFHWSERINYFSSVRLWIAREIANMELDVREMKRERQAIERLVPKANIIVRAYRRVREQMQQSRSNLVRSANEGMEGKSSSSSEQQFLDPMNPASPYYHFPIHETGDETATEGADSEQQ